MIPVNYHPWRSHTLYCANKVQSYIKVQWSCDGVSVKSQGSQWSQEAWRMLAETICDFTATSSRPHRDLCNIFDMSDHAFISAASPRPHPASATTTWPHCNFYQSQRFFEHVQNPPRLHGDFYDQGDFTVIWFRPGRNLTAISAILEVTEVTERSHTWCNWGIKPIS